MKPDKEYNDNIRAMMLDEIYDDFGISEDEGIESPTQEELDAEAYRDHLALQEYYAEEQAKEEKRNFSFRCLEGDEPPF